MAKVSINKLGLKTKNDNVITTEINGQTIEIKQYLPVQDKLSLISEVMNVAVDPQRPYFYDPGRFAIMFDILLLKYYTNITFTDKQLEEPNKLYDLIWSNADVMSDIFDTIPRVEINQMNQWAHTAMGAISQHTQSALGILEIISDDYSNLNLDADSLREKIADPENLKLLKDIAPMVGLS